MIRILMALGAKKIRVEHKSGWSKEFAARITAPLGLTGVDVGAEAGLGKHKGAELIFKAELKGSNRPSLPDNLVWYHHEATWQEIASGRMKYKIRNFSLSLSYEDDFGVNAGLRMTAHKVGLDLGGSFEDHQSTRWHVSGDFKVR